MVERASAGCPHAFAALVAACYDPVYRLAWRLVRSREAAEDVAQDVCVKLATAIRSFRGEARFSTWVYRVTYNAATDHLRRHAEEKSAAAAAAVATLLADAPRSAEADLVASEVWDAVDTLPGQQRDAVLLVYGEDMSHAEAAAIMGCTEKTVSWHLHEARKRLKVRLTAVG